MGTTRQKNSCRNRLQNAPRLLSRAKVCTHLPLLKGSHTRAHTPKQGPSGRGRYHYPRSVPHVHKHPRAGYQNGVLCRFWVLVGDAPEERREPAEQRCAYARRCSEASRPRWAALLCLQLGDVAVLSLCAQYFLNVRGEGWYHYPRRAPHVLETLDGRLSKGFICRFLRLGGHRWFQRRKMCLTGKSTYDRLQVSKIYRK